MSPRRRRARAQQARQQGPPLILLPIRYSSSPTEPNHHPPPKSRAPLFFRISRKLHYLPYPVGGMERRLTLLHLRLSRSARRLPCPQSPPDYGIGPFPPKPSLLPWCRGGGKNTRHRHDKGQRLHKVPRSVSLYMSTTDIPLCPLQRCASGAVVVPTT